MEPVRQDTEHKTTAKKKHGGMRSVTMWCIATVALGCIVIIQGAYLHALSVKVRDNAASGKATAGMHHNGGGYDMFAKHVPFGSGKMTMWTNPFEEMRFVERILDNIGAYQPRSNFSYFPNKIMPKMDIQDKGDHYLITVDIPGVEKDNISVTIHDDILMVEGERHADSSEQNDGRGYVRKEISYGSFHESLTIPSDVDADTINAEYNKGVLTIKLDKKPEASQVSKNVPIKVLGAGHKVS